MQMIRRALFSVLAAALVASGSGCVFDGAYDGGPSAFGPIGPGAGPPVAASPIPALPMPVSPDDCATCRSQPAPLRGPWLFPWWPELSFPCGFGCGDFYWSEWFSDPPEDCDSCDSQGNWIGPRCCRPRFRTHPLYYLLHIPLFGVQERPTETWGSGGYVSGGYGVAAPLEAPPGSVQIAPSPSPSPSPAPAPIPSPSSSDSPKSAAATAPHWLR